MSNLSQETNLLIGALQSLPIAVGTADVRGIVCSVNTAWTSLTGYTAEEAVGQPVALLSFGTAGQDFYNILQQAFWSREPWRGEWVCRTKTGDYFTAEQSVTAVESPNGEVLHVVVTIQDITLRKQMEEDLRLAKERLDDIEQAAGAGTWSWNCATGQIEGSFEWVRLHGIDPERTVLNWELWPLLCTLKIARASSRCSKRASRIGRRIFSPNTGSCFPMVVCVGSARRYGVGTTTLVCR